MNYVFTLDEASAQLVLNALAELPFKTTADLITNLLKQVADQKIASQTELSDHADQPV
jgi:hypothetical protein